MLNITQTTVIQLSKYLVSTHFKQLHDYSSYQNLKQRKRFYVESPFNTTLDGQTRLTYLHSSFKLILLILHTTSNSIVVSILIQSTRTTVSDCHRMRLCFELFRLRWFNESNAIFHEVHECHLYTCI